MCVCMQIGQFVNYEKKGKDKWKMRTREKGERGSGNSIPKYPPHPKYLHGQPISFRSITTIHFTKYPFT